jgi:endonuclease YncB( thermonuclease family)
MIKAGTATLFFFLLGTLFAYGENLYVVDGDTFTLDGETIRILNIDAPELRESKCDAELRLGLVAKHRLSQLLKGGEINLLRGDGNRITDRYGRTLARVRVEGADVGEVLVSERLARPWTGKRRGWCS